MHVVGNFDWGLARIVICGSLAIACMLLAIRDSIKKVAPASASIKIGSVITDLVLMIVFAVVAFFP